jgi:hypothetical protein
MKNSLKSQNFFVSLVTLLLLAFEANNLTVNINPEQVVDTLLSRDAGAIISLVVLNFANPILKLISNASSWSWGFTRSPNFWTQVVTVALAATALIGLEFPADAAPELVSAYYTNQFSIISVAVVINLINPIYHFLKGKKDVSIEA